MKSIKSFKYSLQDESIFNKELDATPQDIIANYKELVIEYYKFANENINVSNRAFYEYIMNRGLDTITHVFITILYHTNNKEIVYYYTQKSIYLYIEFVNQISEIDKHFLKLTSRDAVIYVYKKTIFELGIKKSYNGQHNILDTISKNINIIQTVFRKFTNQICNDKLCNDNNIESFVSTVNSIQLPHQDIEPIQTIIDALFYHVKDNVKFGELVRGLMHHINTPTNTKKIKNLIINDDFLFHVNEPTEVFLKWIFE